jgi:hypothetical protein
MDILKRNGHGLCSRSIGSKPRIVVARIDEKP